MGKPVGKSRGAARGENRSGGQRSLSSGLARAVGLRGVLGVALFVILAGGAALRYWPGGTSNDVVVPRLLDKLHPELIDLINAQVAVVRAAPEDVDANATLGAIYEANGLWPEARICYGRARRLDAKNPAWAYHEAIAAGQSGDSAATMDLLRDAAHRFPESAPIQYRFGDAQLESGDLAGAETAFRTTVKYAPGAVAGYAALGDVLVRKRRFAEAVVPLERAMALDPMFVAPCYLLATSYHALGRVEEGDVMMSRATYKPDRGAKRYVDDPWSERLWKYAKTVSLRLDCSTDLIDLGRIDEALVLLEPMLVTNPDNVKLLEKAGMAYLMQNRLDEAFRLLDRARKLDGDHARVALHLGIYYFKLQKLDDAVREFDRAASLDAELWEAPHMRGVVQLSQNLTEDAFKSFQSAVALRPTNPVVGLKLAEVCVALGKWEEAKAALETVVMYWPTYPPSYVPLARVNLELGLWDDAERCAGTARRLAPHDPTLPGIQRALAARDQ